MTTLSITSLVLFPLFSAVLFVSMGKASLPPPHGATLRLYLTAALAIGSALAAALAAYMFLFLSIKDDATIGRVWAAATCILPVLVLAHSYVLAFPKQRRRLLRGARLVDLGSSLERSVAHVTVEVAQQLGLRRHVQVFTTHRTCAPFVIGRCQRDAIILLPPSIDSIAIKACGGDEAVARDLLRLVVAHEVAHVASGDVYVTPLLWSARKSLRAVGVLFLGSAVGTWWFATDPALKLFAGPAFGVIGAAVVILAVLLEITIRDRERQADALASLCVEPSVLQTLTKGSSKGRHAPPPLELFVVALTAMSPLATRILGFTYVPTRSRLATLTHRVRTRLTLRPPSQPSLFERLHALATKAHALPTHQTWQPIDVVGGAILAAVLTALFDLANWAGFMHHLLFDPLYDDTLIDQQYLKASGVWLERRNTSVGWRLFDILSPLMVGSFVAATFLHRRRDATPLLTGHWMDGLRWTALGVLLWWLAYSVMKAPFDWLLQIPFPRVSAVWNWGWPVSLATLLMTVAFASILPFRYEFPTHRWRRLLLHASLLLGGIVTVIAVTILAMHGLNITARVVWSLTLVMVVWLFYPLVGIAGIVKHHSIMEEALEVYRCFGLRHLVTHTDNYPGRWREHCRLHTITHVGALFLVVILLSAIVHPKLLALDEWHLTHYGVAREGTVTIREDGSSTTEHEDLAPVSRLEGGLLNVYLLHPDGPRPSTLAGGAALAVVLMIMVAGGTIYTLARPRSTPRFLWSVVCLAEFSCLVNDNLVGAHTWRRLGTLLCKRVHREKGYIEGPGGAPMGRLTAAAVIWFRNSTLDRRMSRKMSSWLQQCERPHGGFAVEHSLDADLQLTAFAFRALEHEHAGIDITMHIRFVSGQLDPVNGRRAFLGPEVHLSHVATALLALNQIGHTRPFSYLPRAATALAWEAEAAWWRSRKQPQDTRHLLTVLAALEKLDHSVVGWIREHASPQYEGHLPRLHPERQLSVIADIVCVFQMLYPESWRRMSAVQQVIDNVKRSWRHI